MHTGKDGEIIPDDDEVFDLEGFLKEQREEALRDPNVYFTQKALCREASDDEKLLHFILNGGAKEFRKNKIAKYIRKNTGNPK